MNLGDRVTIRITWYSWKEIPDLTKSLQFKYLDARRGWKRPKLLYLVNYDPNVMITEIGMVSRDGCEAMGGLIACGRMFGHLSLETQKWVESDLWERV